MAFLLNFVHYYSYLQNKHVCIQNVLRSEKVSLRPLITSQEFLVDLSM